MVVLRPPKLDSYFSMRPTFANKTREPVKEFSDIMGGPAAEKKNRMRRVAAAKSSSLPPKPSASPPAEDPSKPAAKTEETNEHKGFLDRRQKAALASAQKAKALASKSPVAIYLAETEQAAFSSPQGVVATLGNLARKASGWATSSGPKARAERQAKIVCGQSSGRLLDRSFEYNTGIPGQKASAEACLPPPLDDVLALVPEEGRPTPVEIIAYMKQRKLRPREATAELILLGQCNGKQFFDGLQNLIDQQEPPVESEGTRPMVRSPLVAMIDSETLDLTIGDWVTNIREEVVTAIQKKPTPGEAPQEDKRRSLNKQRTSGLWINPLTFKTNEKKTLSKKAGADEILDIRWFCAAVLCFPKVVQASFMGYAVGEGLTALGMWGDLQVLNFSNSLALSEESFLFMANSCRQLHWLEVTRCPALHKMEALKECLSLKTVIAHDCVGLECHNSEVLCSSHTMNYLELRGCTSLHTARLLLPNLPSLDLRFLPSLQRVAGSMPALTILNLSKCADLKTIDHFMFKSCPNLQDLTCRGCTNLESLDGLEIATKLRVIRANHCPKLVSLGVDKALEKETGADVLEGKTVFGHVRYIDLHGNTSISDTEVWKFIRSTWSSRDPQQTEVLRRASQVPPIRKKAGLDEVLFHDEKEHTKLITKESHTKMCDFEICHHLETVMAGDGTSSAGYAFVCWPDSKRRESFAKKLHLHERKNLEIVCLGAAQDKFRDAYVASEVAYVEVTQGARQPTLTGNVKKDDAKKIRKVRLAPKEFRDMAKQELEEAVEILADRDLDLLQQGLTELKRVVPEQVIYCCNTGCGLKKTVREVENHMKKECQGRLVKCEQGCGKWVKVCYKEHHEEIEARLEESLKTWNFPKLKAAVNEAGTHCCAPECRWKKVCTGCKLPEPYMRFAEDKLKQLDINVRRVSPVIAKGLISIDFDNCSVDIKADIKFEARKPPDTSASFEDRDSAIEIIADLATVLNAFETPMIIEGHTGQKEPADYWGKLAMARAALICKELAGLGVHPSLARAKGCPGGGAKVLIIPARSQKNG